MTPFEVIPAVDLRGGRVVRLVEGRPENETDYQLAPAEAAARWAREGAKRLHVVDLDAAFSGERENLAAVRAIAGAIEIPFEVGGGVRSAEAARTLLDAGAGWVVVGTAAVAEGDAFRAIAEALPGRVILGLDTRDGCVAVKGWTEVTALAANDLLARLWELPLAAVIHTDIARDGRLAGANIKATEEVVKASPWPVIASGGVSSPEDIARLREAGAAGAILGKALYDGRLALADALAAAEE